VVRAWVFQDSPRPRLNIVLPNPATLQPEVHGAFDQAIMLTGAAARALLRGPNCLSNTDIRKLRNAYTKKKKDTYP